MSVIKFLLPMIFPVIVILMVLTVSTGAIIQMKKSRINLPKTVDGWTRNDTPQLVDVTNIFDYMDGAGELYLGYRFDHLDVYEYQTDDSLNNILVELYFMQNSDDAFGLLSLDWSGEPVNFGDSLQNDSIPTVAPSIRALYGGGLLRIWSDDLYVRIMAYRETPASKAAIMRLGRSITSHRNIPPPPQLLRVLPVAFTSDWILRPDRIGYLRSYLVLNSLYYLSHHNILDLDHSTEGVTASYENKGEQADHQWIQILFVKYATDLKAQKALEHFIEGYLPEHQIKETQAIKSKCRNFFKIEDGWLGYQLDDKSIAIVFQCPDKKCAQDILNELSFSVVDK